jgi:8-oxo-dGTP pyrophosphatase MutT (NUDIX family)
MNSFKRFVCCIPGDTSQNFIQKLQEDGYCVYNITDERICLDKITGDYTLHKTAGIILFNRTFDKVLLVCNAGGYIWGFPKGTTKINETLEETAVRELFEETNVKISDKNLVKSVKYKTELNIDEKIREKYRKKWTERRPNEKFRFENIGMHIIETTLFIGCIDENITVKSQTGEISKIKWIELKNVQQLIGYNEITEAFIDTLEILKIEK